MRIFLEYEAVETVIYVEIRGHENNENDVNRTINIKASASK